MLGAGRDCMRPNRLAVVRHNYSPRRSCDSKRSQRLSMLEDDWLSCPPKLFADGAIPEVVTA
jgi:hypothetical protein